MRIEIILWPLDFLCVCPFIFVTIPRGSPDIHKSILPGSKCEALQLGVHLILLYFIRILVVGTEIIFLFCGCGCWCGCGCGCGCGWRTFFVFKSLNNNMVYTSDIDVCVYKRNRCTTKVLWVLKFWEVGGQEFFFKMQVGWFLIFYAKLHVWCWFLLFLSKRKTCFWDFFKSA